MPKQDAHSAQIVIEARKLVGSLAVPYSGPHQGLSWERGFDCSGAVSKVVDVVGLGIRHIRHTNEYYDYFGIHIHPDFVRAGDLVFFSYRGYVPDHMGIMVTRTRCVHAAKEGRVVECDISIIAPTRINVEPHPSYPDIHQLYSQNPIGFKRPTLPSRGDRYRTPII